MNHDRKHSTRPSASGLDVAQKVAALTLAVISVGSSVFVAGGLFYENRATRERVSDINRRITIIETWRSELDKLDTRNSEQHRRFDELMRDIQQELQNLLKGNKP